MAVRVVILGGTSDGRQLAERLANDPRWAPLLSFAGRTESLVEPRAPFRVGGFGGAEGLARFLGAERCAALIDATHPFAAQISANAVRAAEWTGTPLLRVECPAWREEPGDDWTHVACMADAAVALGGLPRRVFLSVGRLEVEAFRAAPWHSYLIRAVDDFLPDLPTARVLAQRGPFALDAEFELFARERIEVLVSKNAGTAATHAKLIAARRLRLPVVMVARPELPAAPTVASSEAALTWLEERLHAGSLALRGV
jgi:precorrin-6A/cobalt-precorrin-6A reductase